MNLIALSTRSRRLFLSAGLLASAAVLAACSMFSSGPPVLNVNVVASAAVNPDSNKRPSPVMVRIYELKAPASFEQADFVSLFEKDQAVLGGDLVTREEFVMRPGDTKPITKPLSPDTKAIGVMVAFRELERARWRAVVPVVAGKKNVISVDLSDIAVLAKRTSPKP